MPDAIMHLAAQTRTAQILIDVLTENNMASKVTGIYTNDPTQPERNNKIYCLGVFTKTPTDAYNLGRVLASHKTCSTTTEFQTGLTVFIFPEAEVQAWNPDLGAPARFNTQS